LKKLIDISKCQFDLKNGTYIKYQLKMLTAREFIEFLQSKVEIYLK